MLETWHQMTVRHQRERRELVEGLAARRITQSEAARNLGTSLGCLNNFIRRNGISWPVKRQGRRPAND